MQLQLCWCLLQGRRQVQLLWAQLALPVRLLVLRSRKRRGLSRWTFQRLSSQRLRQLVRLLVHWPVAVFGSPRGSAPPCRPLGQMHLQQQTLVTLPAKRHLSLLLLAPRAPRQLLVQWALMLQRLLLPLPSLLRLARHASAVRLHQVVLTQWYPHKAPSASGVNRQQTGKQQPRRRQAHQQAVQRLTLLQQMQEPHQQ